MGARDVLGAGVAVAVAALVAIVGMVAVLATSECRSSPVCDNLGAAWAALTVGAGLFTLVLSGYLIWVLSRRGVRELSAAASVATATAVVVGGVWGTVWLVELASPIGLLFPIASVAPLLALPASDRTFGVTVAVTLACLGVLAWFVWYLPAVTIQAAALSLAVWARRRARLAGLTVAGHARRDS